MKFDSELIKGYALLVEAPGDQEIPLNGGAPGMDPAAGGGMAPPAQGMPTAATPPPSTEEQGEGSDTDTSEGTIMLITLVKKALFIDPAEIDLSLADKSLLAKEVTPKNAMKMSETLKRIVNNYEYPEAPGL
jgi:hypothetical protein